MRELLIGSLSTLFLSSACLVTVWLWVFLDYSHFGVCGVCFNCGFTHHWNCEEGKDVSSFFVMKPIWHKEEGLILIEIVSFWSPGLCPSYDVLLVGLGQKVLALSLVARAFYSRSAFFFPRLHCGHFSGFVSPNTQHGFSKALWSDLCGMVWDHQVWTTSRYFWHLCSFHAHIGYGNCNDNLAPFL